MKRALILALAIIQAFFAFACSQNSQLASSLADERHASAYTGPPGTWAVYWYMCGSDLESISGSGTLDIMEMLETRLPEGVTVVLQTGGAQEWQNDYIDPGFIERFVYKGSSLDLVGKEPLANMGDPKTFSSFLSFCNENYPAEKQMAILWDHGGGSLWGMESDEIFHGDCLTLPEFKQAIESVPAVSGAYEIVGFDACLMATIEIAEILIGDAKRLVASQELEPAYGWDYKGIFSALAKKPSMGGKELGKIICDTYYKDCEKNGRAKEATLSVIDLEKAPELIKAYDEAGGEALLSAADGREEYLSRFGRAALGAKKFGGGNYDMVDLADLAKLSKDLLPKKSEKLLKAVEGCVEYQAKGEYNSGACGLSCYYNLSGGSESMALYQGLNTSEPFSYFYEYASLGDLVKEGKEYIKALAYQEGLETPEVAVLPSILASELDGFPVYVGANGLWEMKIGPDRAKKVSEVYTQLFWVEPMSGLMAMYGSNKSLFSDFNKGIFIENFNNTWGCIDNTPVFMEPIGSEPGHTLYRVPVMLNSEEYTLHVGYNDAKKDYEILGAWKSSDESKASSKNVRSLQPGDIIEPILTLIPAHEDGSRSIEEMPLGMLTVTENTKFYNRDIGTGYFALFFKIIDYAGNAYVSSQASFRVPLPGGKIERLAGGIAPMAIEQPEGSMPIMHIKKDAFFHEGRNEELSYYTATVSPELYMSMGEELGIDNPQNGDSAPDAGYSIQIYSDKIDLSKYEGIQKAYATGVFFEAETIYHRRDIVMRVDQLIEVW